jgi:hypothetical protein
MISVHARSVCGLRRRLARLAGSRSHAVTLVVADQFGVHVPTDLIRRATYGFKGNN